MINHLGVRQSVGEFLLHRDDATLKQFIFSDSSYYLQRLVHEMISKHPYNRPKSRKVLQQLTSSSVIPKIRTRPIEDPFDDEKCGDESLGISTSTSNFAGEFSPATSKRNMFSAKRFGSMRDRNSGRGRGGR